MRISRLLVAAGAVCVLPLAVTEVNGAQSSDATAQTSIAECGRSIRTAASRKQIGRRLHHGGLLAMLASIPVGLSSMSRDFRKPPDRTRMEVGHYLGIAGVVAQFSGLVMVNRSSTSSAEWDDALQHLNVGRATASDVEACLGEPMRRSSSTITSNESSPLVSETAWEYQTRTRNSLFSRSTLRVVTISFKDSIVSGIKVTESR